MQETRCSAVWMGRRTVCSLGWRRRAHSVCYYQNHIKRRNGYYYTLSFKIRVPHANDVTYVAYTHPYTQTDLNRYLRNLESDPQIAKRFRRRPLCETLSGNTIELLTVTADGTVPADVFALAPVGAL